METDSARMEITRVEYGALGPSGRASDGTTSGKVKGGDDDSQLSCGWGNLGGALCKQGRGQCRICAVPSTLVLSPGVN